MGPGRRLALLSRHLRCPPRLLRGKRALPEPAGHSGGEHSPRPTRVKRAFGVGVDHNVRTVTEGPGGSHASCLRPPQTAGEADMRKMFPAWSHESDHHRLSSAISGAKVPRRRWGARQGPSGPKAGRVRVGEGCLVRGRTWVRSEEHTSELQSRFDI